MSIQKAESVNPTEEPDVNQDICVLVVDCDSTSLTIVSAMLRTLKYEVMTVERAADALTMTMEKENGVDLVMAELHMPDMNGLELLREIQKTSKLPVVIMSADDHEDAMVTSLQEGAFFYIVKPVLWGDIKNLWLYVLSKRRENLPGKTKKKCSVEDESLGDNEPNEDGDHGDGALNDQTEESSEDKEEDTLTSPLRKKAKLTWTPQLHNQFLSAVDELGVDNAHPKKILQLMNVEGLTKEHISSHLQKHRLTVQRERQTVQSVVQFATRTAVDHLGSGFAPHHPQSVFNLQQGIQVPKLPSTARASQPGFAGCLESYPATHAINHGQPILLFNQTIGHYPVDAYGGIRTPTSGEGWNQIDMALNAGNHDSGNARSGYRLFTNSIQQRQLMQPPQTWPPPPLPPPKKEQEGSFEAEEEGDEWFDDGITKADNRQLPK